MSVFSEYEKKTGKFDVALDREIFGSVSTTTLIIADAKLNIG